jgi:hypothetical protein
VVKTIVVSASAPINHHLTFLPDPEALFVADMEQVLVSVLG